MRSFLIGCLALLAACAERREPGADNVASAAVEPRAANMTNHAEAPPPPAVPAEPPDDYPGVAELSPSQRRAYERGWRDCRAGRYAPGEWAEAYRIGCAAAQEGR